MFTQMFGQLRQGKVVEPGQMRRWFDLAMTKKQGVLRTPPVFWSADPKINPRSDHLLWVALLLDDPRRIELALSVLAMEYAERQPPPSWHCFLEQHLQELFSLVPTSDRARLEQAILALLDRH